MVKRVRRGDSFGVRCQADRTQKKRKWTPLALLKGVTRESPTLLTSKGSFFFGKGTSKG